MRPSALDRDRHMVGTTRQRRTVEPAVDRRVIDVVVVAIDRTFAVPVQHMHAPNRRRGPGHLAARNRQGSPRHPAPARPSRRSAVRHALTLLLWCHVVRHAALQFGVRVGGGWGDRQGGMGAGVRLGAGMRAAKAATARTGFLRCMRDASKAAYVGVVSQ